MQETSTHITDDSALDKRCRASVEASMRFFNLELGKVCIIPETSLYSLISRCLHQTVDIFGLSESSTAVLLEPSALEHMLKAIFDADCRPFVLKDCVSVLATLDPEARACILAQAVAGIISIVHKLATVGGDITPVVLARDLHVFEHGQERKDVLGRIEHSQLFHSCLIKKDVQDLILAAISRSDVHFEAPARAPEPEEYEADKFGMGERPASNMGVSGGFTIMALI